MNDYDGIIVAVGHSIFKSLDFKKAYDSNKIIYDLKGIVQKDYINE